MAETPETLSNPVYQEAEEAINQIMIRCGRRYVPVDQQVDETEVVQAAGNELGRPRDKVVFRLSLMNDGRIRLLMWRAGSWQEELFIDFDGKGDVFEFSKEFSIIRVFLSNLQ